MLDTVTAFGVLLLTFWLFWNFIFSKLWSALLLNQRILALPIPELRASKSNRLYGNLIEFQGQTGVNPDLPPNSLILQYACGLLKLIEDKSIVRMNVGLIKQVVILGKADSVECLLGNYQETTKSVEYTFAKPWVGTGLLTSNSHKWKKHRRLLNPTFNPRILEQFIPIMSEHSATLVNIIKKDVRKDNIIMDNLLANCALDVITEATMGTKIHAQGKEISPYVTSLNRVLALFTRRVLSPWLWPECLFQLSPTGWEMYKEIRVVHNFVRKIIINRKEQLSGSHQDQENLERKKGKTFLDLLLLHNSTCKPEDKLSDQDIEDEVHTFAFAGYDTVTSTATWIIFYLGHHPHLQKRAQEEVDEIFRGDAGRDITVDDMKRMSFLDRVIKESQRLTPVIPVLLRDIQSDLNIKGVTIPGGTTVCAFLSALHMDPSVFPQPEIFDPDRFLDSKISPYAFVPFSAGPRNCIGQKYAIFELKSILSQLLRNFDWTSLDPRDQVLVNPDPISRPSRTLRFDFQMRMDQKA